MNNPNQPDHIDTTAPGAPQVVAGRLCKAGELVCAGQLTDALQLILEAQHAVRVMRLDRELKEREEFGD